MVEDNVFKKTNQVTLGYFFHTELNANFQSADKFFPGAVNKKDEDKIGASASLNSSF